MKTVLLDNIASFWYPRSIDTLNGGYHLNFDAAGRPAPEEGRLIVSQARMVWFFSRLAREGYEKPGAFTKADLLAAARHGYGYLRDTMWDKEHGGFYWMTSASGRVTAPNKHLYGQAFGLYALSEYYLATGDREALELATRLFEILEQRAHDVEHGGYREYFHADWSEVPAGMGSYMDPDRSDLKLMNTHVHLLEAMTAFYRAGQLPLARKRLLELIGVETDKVVRKNVVACTDKHEPDWTPILTGSAATVSYGHGLENIWLVADACDAAGVSTGQYVPLFRDLWAFSLKNGYDTTQGGFFSTGPLDGPATDRSKEWWVQGEALVSALHMYRWTGDVAYREVFDKTWQFIWRRQIDHENGEWYRTVLPSGQARGAKGDAWKCAYHDGRAMMEAIRLLEEPAQ